MLNKQLPFIYLFSDGTTHTLELMDTAGLHIVPSMQKQSIKSGKAFALVYDISNVMSFLNALDLVDEINIVKGKYLYLHFSVR